MFSGIVEEIGQIQAINKQDAFTEFTIHADLILADIKLGDSIAVNGTCLTVMAQAQQSFTIQAVPETLARTNLGELQVDNYVNLERAVLPTTRLGGHLLQGHVDTTTTFLEFETVANGLYAHFALPKNYAHLFIDKGYVAIDGMSLTIAKLAKESFTIAFIPYTMNHTIAQYYQPNISVNIEVDMVGKYLQRFMQFKELSYA